MHKTCANPWCKQSFEITDDDLAFYALVSPVFGGKKYAIPPPTLCPECRQQRRYACRNDRNYYQGTCGLCKRPLITSYSPDKSIPILCDVCFFGDKWDPLSYGQSYDASQSFFDQFKRLRETVPRLAIYHTQSENSEYTVHSSRNRNCFVGSSLVDCEDVHYSDFTFRSGDCLDLFSCDKMELCSECLFCNDCSSCDWCENCNNLSDAMFCFDCRGGGDLIGCVGLRNQRKKILNRDATTDECAETRRTLNSDTAFRSSFQEKFEALKLRHPHPPTWMTNAENCSGNYIWSSKNAHVCFNVRQMEDTRFIYEAHRHVDTMDCCRISNGELLYDCASIVDLKYAAFCNLTYQCDRLLYCDNCTGTSECFGCFGLKKYRHCILNKQYTKEGYEDLVPRIIGDMQLRNEWGEFFPATLSVFCYNESKAHEWYPLDEEGVRKRGWKWSGYELPMPENVRTINGIDVPSSIEEIPDDILQWAILCEVTGRPFKIIKQELDFYRIRGLPVPKRSPKQRHYDRIGSINIRTLYDRSCAKCAKPIQTIYGPNRSEIVFCGDCYLKEVY